jgi:hypothetical protein
MRHEMRGNPARERIHQPAARFLGVGRYRLGYKARTDSKASLAKKSSRRRANTL